MNRTCAAIVAAVIGLDVEASAFGPLPVLSVACFKSDSALATAMRKQVYIS